MDLRNDDSKMLHTDTIANMKTDVAPSADATRADVTGSPIPASADRHTGDGHGIEQAGPPSMGTPPNGTPSNGHTSRGGAPSGNANALQHGLRGSPDVAACRLVLGTLTRKRRPDDSPAEIAQRRALAKVEEQARQFRVAVEQAVLDAHGSISLTHACLIATAARWERHGLLALRWLRERHDALDDSQRLAYSKAIAEASERRDKAIAALRLERKPTDWWDDYYAGRTATPAAITDDGDGHHDQTFGHDAGDTPNAAVDGHDGQRDNEHGTGDGGITP